jgi:Tol biopolymer transport system component
VVSPEWTPDGKRLIYTTWYEKKPTIWWQSADGGQAPEKLLELPDGSVVRNANVTPDGKGIVFCRVTDLSGNADLFLLRLVGDRTPQRLAGPFRWGCSARVSPDGKWLAYVANDEATTNVYVRRMGDEGARVRVSRDGGDMPRWSRDGSLLFYRHAETALGRGALFVAPVRFGRAGLEVGERRRVLWLGEGGVFDVHPDGKHVVLLEDSGARIRLVVTTNWVAQLRARLAERR